MSLNDSQRAALEKEVIAALRRVYDPEIPVSIYDLGLIYKLEIGADGQVSIRMTLTAPNCPVAGSLPAEVERKVGAVPGVAGVRLQLVFDPPWDKNMMSPAAKLALGLDDVISIRPLRR